MGAETLGSAERGAAERWLGRVAWALDRISEIALFSGLVVMIATVLAGVISRYVFNAAFTWTDELASWMFVWLICIGVPFGHRCRRHIALDLLPGMLGEKWRGLFATISDLVVAYVAIMMIFAGAILIERITGLSGALQWPSNMKYILLPYCGVALLGYLFLNALEEPGRIAWVAGAVVLASILYLAVTVFGVVPFPGMSPSLLMFIAFATALALGVPVVFTVSFAVFATTWTDGSMLPPAAVLQNMVAGANRFILLAIPFFLTASFLLNIGGVTSRLIDFATSLVGHLRGGLAQVNVVNSALVGGISGSSSADAASDSKLIVPEMIKRGYPPPFACAVTASSAIIPNVIPPAISMLVYASIADTSIARLFVAGIVPGMLLTVVMMAIVYASARLRNFETRRERQPLSQVLRMLMRALPALSLSIAIVGSIRYGIATPTEAAVIAVLWAFGLGTLLYRAYDLLTLYRTLVDAALETALIGFLIAVTVPFAWVLIAEQVPQHVVGVAVETFGGSGTAVLLLVILSLLIIGTVLDGSAAMLIVVPLFLPLARAFGIDPTQFGIVVIITMMMGTITPPFGLLVFISSSITRVAPGAIFRECVPFLLGALAVLLAVAFVPTISLGLWHLIE